MKKTFEIRDIDCANCALKIENEFKKIDGLKDVKIDFAKQKIFIDGDTKTIDAKYLEKIAKKIESGVSVYDKDEVIEKKHTLTINHLSVFLGVFILGVFLIINAFIYSFAPSVSFIIYLVSYLCIGGKVIFKAIKNISRGQIFDENFLMMIATIGAFFISEYIEGIAVMLFYQIGEYFQDLAVHRSRNNIESLMDLKPNVAHLFHDELIDEVKPEDLKINDVVLVKPGEKIPVDGIILSGQTHLDESSLTGESKPVYKEQNDDVLSGSLNINGSITVLVKKTYKDSSVYKIIEFVEQNVAKKAKTEQFITKFAKYYTPIVVGIALLLAFVVPLVAMRMNLSTYQQELSIYLERALIFLVISCPCALVLSIPLSFYAGIGKASKSGILVKSGSDLETFASIDHFVFDKTGTLTKGEFIVTKVFADDKDLILKLASHAESRSNHPIALSIMRAYKESIIEKDIKDFEEVFGQGIKVTYQNKICLVGNDKLLKAHQIDFEMPHIKHTVIHVAYDKTYIGYIVLEDELKISAKETITTLKELNKSVSMITGDHKFIALDIAKKLGINNVYYEQLPHEKKDLIEKLKLTHKTAFVGDGINDAPVLISADLGISMGSLGSDLAVEASDAVIMNDEPIQVIEAMNISKKTKKVVIENIILAAGTKFIVLILGAFGFANMWLAIFADVGISLIAVIHAMSILKNKRVS
ncbi:MAG: heavy metal translocating P-type ATPase [Acholeplasmataceae bacterium]